MDRSSIDSARRRLRYAWILVSMLAALGAFAGASAQDKGARFDDAVITQRVNGALDADPVLRQMHIAVDTRDGVVHLTGFVGRTRLRRGDYRLVLTPTDVAGNRGKVVRASFAIKK